MGYLSGLPFNVLALVDLCAFGGIFAATLFGCVISKRIRYARKAAFFHLVNLFAAVTLALFCTRYSAPQSIAAGVIFWCVGYLLYGLLCALSRRPVTAVAKVEKPAPVAVATQPATRTLPAPSAPPASSAVRLDHASSIADKLLLKALGRSDRQELEKIKTALTVFKIKGDLSPQDGEALNDMFNALLKLMAKYDV